MGARHFTLDTPLGASHSHGTKDHWTLCDAPSDLAALPCDRAHTAARAWQGGSHAQAAQWARDGKLEHVAASDRWLEHFEALAEQIITPSSRIIEDVAGAVPNVPAYVAGVPLTMRRRTRDTSDRAPVCVIVDTTISAGCSQDDIKKRGAVILALVRLLSVRRPLELWTGTGLNHGRGAAYCFTRLDTTPLDLARAAFMLCDTAATRCLGYGALMERGAGGGWPYNGGRALQIDAWRTIAAQAFPHLSHFVPVPGLHLNDPLLRDPLAWISARLREFGELGDD